jgi:hypothetical protein
MNHGEFIRPNDSYFFDPDDIMMAFCMMAFCGLGPISGFIGGNYLAITFATFHADARQY